MYASPLNTESSVTLSATVSDVARPAYPLAWDLENDGSDTGSNDLTFD